MRITGGELAGRRLRVPRGGRVRPTADRVRESLFARLGDLSGVRVLDLFAGSGALGIEALSRGASDAVFVERSSAVAAVLAGNLAALGLEERARVLRRPVDAALRDLSKGETSFDVVFADPPYGAGRADPVLAALGEARVVAPGGLVVIETDRRHPPGSAGPWREEHVHRYGDTLVTWLRHVAEKPEARRSDD